jgi:cobalt/nickel transport system permease protein
MGSRKTSWPSLQENIFDFMLTNSLASHSLYLALHVPDGFLNGPVSLVTTLLAIILLGFALRYAQREYQEKTVPLMGVCAAFIFAAQMVNFPIPGGTSGHLLGGTIAAVLLGPWAGSLVMTVVFIVQALFFQDGGITALGANITNMGLVGTLGGYYLYRLIRQASFPSMLTAVAITSWLSVVVAAVLCALQLAISGTVPLDLVLGAMLGWHILIGIGEALISVAVISFVARTRPDLLYDRRPRYE